MHSRVLLCARKAPVITWHMSDRGRERRRRALNGVQKSRETHTYHALLFHHNLIL